MNGKVTRWLLLVAPATVALASAPAIDKPFSIERADPALDAVIAPDARLKLLGDRFGITEGPRSNSSRPGLWQGGSALHKLPLVAS
jgi:hypothetical protein